MTKIINGTPGGPIRTQAWSSTMSTHQRGGEPIEIVVPGGTRVGVRMTTGTSQSATVTVEGEE